MAGTGLGVGLSEAQRGRLECHLRKLAAGRRVDLEQRVGRFQTRQRRLGHPALGVGARRPLEAEQVVER